VRSPFFFVFTPGLFRLVAPEARRVCCIAAWLFPPPRVSSILGFPQLFFYPFFAPSPCLSRFNPGPRGERLGTIFESLRSGIPLAPPTIPFFFGRPTELLLCGSRSCGRHWATLFFAKNKKRLFGPTTPSFSVFPHFLDCPWFNLCPPPVCPTRICPGQTAVTGSVPSCTALKLRFPASNLLFRLWQGVSGKKTTLPLPIFF